jgi:hypothetical protein
MTFASFREGFFLPLFACGAAAQTGLAGNIYALLKEA